MALGIDDILSTATGGIKLLSTISKTIDKYKKVKADADLSLLLEEVKLAVLARIDDADLALSQFERTIVETGVAIDKPISDVVASASFWHPFEAFRLKQIHKRFNAFSDSIYSATDDIAALVRCQKKQHEMGSAIVDAFHAKHALQERMLKASSLKEAIHILRMELKRQKHALSTDSTAP